MTAQNSLNRGFEMVRAGNKGIDKHHRVSIIRTLMFVPPFGGRSFFICSFFEARARMGETPVPTLVGAGLRLGFGP